MQSPIIIAIVVAGILIGDLLRRTDVRIGWRRSILGSLVGGIGNAIYATALVLLGGGTIGQTKSLSAERLGPLPEEIISFLVSSFIAGALIILLMFLVATITIRILGRTVVEEE
ncbi:MAG: hypothetical protein QW265_00255 [Candidatus Bathyarchaeia archaeon]